MGRTKPDHLEQAMIFIELVQVDPPEKPRRIIDRSFESAEEAYDFVDSLKLDLDGDALDVITAAVNEYVGVELQVKLDHGTYSNLVLSIEGQEGPDPKDEFPLPHTLAEAVTQETAYAIGRVYFPDDTPAGTMATIGEDLNSFFRLYVDVQHRKAEHRKVMHGSRDLQLDWFVQSIIAACDSYAVALYG